MRITDHVRADLDLQAQERKAERELVAVVLEAYKWRQSLPLYLEARCKRLAAIKARRAALLDGGGEGEGQK